MSLRAKIEAVIFAAEEPVTLLQLATLLRPEIEAELRSESAARPEAEPSAPAVVGDTPGQVLYFGPEVSIPVTPEMPATPDIPVAPETDGKGSSAPGHTDAPSASAPEDSLSGASVPAAPHPDSPPPSDRDLRAFVRRVLDQLIAEYASSDRGMEIREVAGGFRMATKPEYHDTVRQFVRSLKPPMKLSLPALETLAVVAYKQPVTAPEVADIRGVDSAGVLGSLLGRKLITTAGRKQVIGRPILYKTTREFLLRFGLRDLKDLPSMEEFEKMAGALAEAEDESAAVQSNPALLASPESTPAEPSNAHPGTDADQTDDGGTSEAHPSLSTRNGIPENTGVAAEPAEEEGTVTQ